MTNTCKGACCEIWNFLLTIFGLTGNIEAKNAAETTGYWLDLNVPEAGLHEDAVDCLISEMLSQRKKEKSTERVAMEGMLFKS